MVKCDCVLNQRHIKLIECDSVVRKFITQKKPTVENQLKQFDQTLEKKFNQKLNIFAFFNIISERISIIIRV